MRRLWLSALLSIALASVSLGRPQAALATCTITNTFSPGTTILSSQVNANFSGVATCINGLTSGVAIILYVNAGNPLATTTSPPQVADAHALILNIPGTLTALLLTELDVYCVTAGSGAGTNTVQLWRGPSGTSFAQIGSSLSWTSSNIATQTFTGVAIAANDVLQVKVTALTGTAPQSCTIVAGGNQAP